VRGGKQTLVCSRTVHKPISIMLKNIAYLLLLLPIGICAQTKKDIEPKNESYITTDLFSPFYFQGNTNGFSNNGTPRWRIGYIKNLNPKSKIGIDIGYGNASSSIIETFDNYSLWEIRPEYYHIINPKRKTLKYFSLELFLYVIHVFIGFTSICMILNYFK